jgi:hypothetical protein
MKKTTERGEKNVMQVAFVPVGTAFRRGKLLLSSLSPKR